MHRRPASSDRRGHVVGPAALAGLISAGQMKASPLFAWVPVDMTALFAVAVAVAMVAARGRFGPTTGRVAVPIVLWATFLPAMAWTSLGGYATVKVLTLFTVSMLLAVAPFYLLRTRRQQASFLAALAVVAVLFGITAFLLNPTTTTEYGNRLVFEGANTIGTGRVAMSGGIVMALYATQPNVRTRTRLLLASLTLLASTLGVMTGSVGPVSGAALALIAVVATAPLFRKYRTRAIVAFLAAAAAAAWIALAYGSDGAQRIVNTLTGEASTSGNARLDMWRHSLDGILGSPFGSGWGSYQSPSRLHDYPHNLVLEVGLEAGWVPMIMIVGLIVATVMRGVRVATSVSTAALYGLFLFAAFNAMVSGDVNGTRIMWATMFALWVTPLPGHEDRPYYSRPRDRHPRHQAT